MANPLAPGVRVQGKHITSRNVAFKPSPFTKQGNVTSGSTFPAAGNHDSLGGNSGSYRIAANPRFKRHSSKSNGFGAVKRPTEGKSPTGVFPASKRGNFGKV